MTPMDATGSREIEAFEEVHACVDTASHDHVVVPTLPAEPFMLQRRRQRRPPPRVKALLFRCSTVGPCSRPRLAEAELALTVAPLPVDYARSEARNRASAWALATSEETSICSSLV